MNRESRLNNHSGGEELLVVEEDISSNNVVRSTVPEAGSSRHAFNAKRAASISGAPPSVKFNELLPSSRQGENVRTKASNRRQSTGQREDVGTTNQSDLVYENISATLQ